MKRQAIVSESPTTLVIPTRTLEHDRDDVLVFPGTATSDHLDEYTAKRPDVDLDVVALALVRQNFGGHPEDRTLHARRALVETLDIRCVIDILAQTK